MWRGLFTKLNDFNNKELVASVITSMITGWWSHQEFVTRQPGSKTLDSRPYSPHFFSAENSNHKEKQNSAPSSLPVRIKK